MSTAAAIVNLGAELVVFIAAASLLLVALTRPQFLGVGAAGRVVVEAGALTLAVTAVVRGVSGDLDPGTGALAIGRGVAAAAILAGAFDVRRRAARQTLQIGAVLLLAAEVGFRADADVVGDVLRGFGGLALGLTAFSAARRSIAMRIAASATLLLVIVVLVLSAVLSVVVTGNIADEALQRTEERSSIEAGIAAQQSNEAVGQSDFIAQVLATSGGFRDAVRTGDFSDLQAAVEQLRSDYRQVDFIAVIDAQGAPQVGAGLDQGDSIELAGLPVVADALDGNAAASVDLLGGGLVALGATPVSIADERGIVTQVAVAATGVRLNEQFLVARLQEQRQTSFTLLTADRVAASTRTTTPSSLEDAVGADLADEVRSKVLGSGIPVSAETSIAGGDEFVAVAPVVRSDGRPVAALVVATESGLVEDTRVSLFRTVFLVSLVALALASLFAVLVGARVAAPVRRLTDAAQRVAEGDLDTRAGIEAADEIGTLGSAFDSMTGSIGQMTREIREAAAQTEAILGGMAEGLVATDADGAVVAMNPAAESMLRTRETTALGKAVDAVVKGTDDAGTALAERLARPMRRPISFNASLSRRGGTLAVAMSGSPIHDEDGELIGRVYVMRDIQAEAEVEAMKSEFLANISHELRTPLTPIKGYAEMMISKNVPADRQRRFLESILEGAERLERYVDMLVNFSAMEAGRFELQTEEVDVADLARRVAERWDSRSPGHQVDAKVSSKLPRVSADPRLLERALNELVDNAVKYSPDGGKVIVRARATGSGPSRRVEVSVVDRGIGIDKKHLDDIFSDFAQLDGSSTRRYGGLGLGLSFVNRVVRAHQGTLTAESDPGSGSEFSISLPPATASTPAPKRSRAKKAGTRKSAGRKAGSRSAKKATRTRRAPGDGSRSRGAATKGRR